MSVSELLAQQQRITARMAKLSQTLASKEDIIENLKSQLASQTRDLNELKQQNSQLSHIVRGLSQHITEELGAILPTIPLPSPIKSRANSHGPSSRSKKSAGTLAVKTKPLIKDTYADFAGSSLLDETIEAQLRRSELTRTLGTLFNRSSRPVIKGEIHTVAFESLSLLMSLRNLSHCNHAEIYLPRVLVMLADLFEVERVSVYVLGANSTDVHLHATTINPVSEVIFHKSQDHFDSVFSNKQPVILHEPAKLKTDMALGIKTKNLLCVPIIKSNRAIGAIEIANKVNEITSQDTALLAEVARRFSDYLGGMKAAQAKQTLHENYESAEAGLLASHMAAIASFMQLRLNLTYVEIYRSDTQRLMAYAGDENADFSEFLQKTLASSQPKVHKITTSEGPKELLSLQTRRTVVQVTSK
jgi:GAF domain-containing protein